MLNNLLGQLTQPKASRPTMIGYRVVMKVFTSPLAVSLSVSGVRTEQCWSLHSAFLSSNAVLFNM